MWGFFIFVSSLSACNNIANQQQLEPAASTIQASNTKPTSVGAIPLPKGYKRLESKKGDYKQFLREIILKPNKTVYLYNRQKKRNQSAQYAVLALDVGTSDLQQCADAAMRLRAEYLFQQRKYSHISFNFTNGFVCDFEHYAKGYRLRINGNKTNWVKQKPASYSHSTLRQYLDLVYSYAGTLSLHRQLKAIPLAAIEPGAVFIQTGNPYGHAVTVMDMAYNATTKDTIFLLSQSYMPAQDIHILVNPIDEQLSPWYSTKIAEELHTPEWTFTKNDLRKF